MNTYKTNLLTYLANKYGSDKGIVHGGPPHKYTYMYDIIFQPLKNSKINFLEIGLAVGGPEVGGAIDRQAISPSVQMWLDYFPQAHIYGFDICDFSHMKNERFTFIRGDSGSVQDMRRLSNSASCFDIIIDDGSHASFHQQNAFKHLFHKLNPGGIYIIEDLQWQSPTYENNYTKLPLTRDFFISFFEEDRYIENPLLSADFMHSVHSSLSNYAWFPAFNGNASPAKIFVLIKS